jgi:hypothetical protein
LILPVYLFSIYLEADCFVPAHNPKRY